MKLTTQRLKKLVREELKKINESEDFENPLGIKPPPEMPKTRAQEDEEEAINMVIAYIAALLIGGYTAHLIQSDIEVAKKISEMPADEIEDILNRVKGDGGYLDKKLEFPMSDTETFSKEISLMSYEEINFRVLRTDDMIYTFKAYLDSNQDDYSELGLTSDKGSLYREFKKRKLRK